MGRAARRAERVQQAKKTDRPGPAFPARAVVAVIVLGHGLLAYLLLPRPIFDKYPVAAAELAGGGGGILPSDLSPLYLVLHVLLLPTPGGLVRFLQVLFGIAAGVAVARLAFRYDGRRGAIVAAVAYALAAPLVAYEATLEPDALLASFAVLSLAATTGEAPLAAGILAGLGVALRPTLIVFALLQAGWLAWRGSRGALLRYAGAVLLAALVPIGLVRLRLGGETRAVMSLGQVLHQSNSPLGIGLGGQYLPLVKPLESQANHAGSGGADWAHEAYRRLAVADAGRPLDAFEAEVVWVRKVVAFVRRHPVAWLDLEWLKAKLVFGPFERHDIVPVFLYERTLPLLPALLLYPLGAFGLVWMLARGRGRPVVAAALTLAVPFLVFDVTARYRVAWAPLAAIGVGALADLVAALRERAQRRAAFAAVGAGLILVFPPATHRAAMRALENGVEASSAYVRADAARRQAKVTEARSEMQRALAALPAGFDALDLRGVDWDDPRFWDEMRPLVEGPPSPRGGAAFDAGLVEARADRREEALRRFRTALDDGFYLDYKDGGEPAYEMGVLLLQSGRVEEARAALARSLERRPGVLKTLVAAELAAREAGAEPAAREAGAEIAALHDRISGSYERARLYRILGRAREAESALQPALAAFGYSALVQWELALAESGIGNRDAALAAYRACLELLPSYPFEAAALDRDVFAAQAENPRDLDRLRLAAEHAMRRGLFTQAARFWREALALSPELRTDPAIMGQLEYAERAR